MDIWNWVEKLRADLREAGQEQSARLIDELTAYVCDLEVERAEALLPEVKALSRTLNNPWLEIFVRHWEMRNRVGNQLEGETALADAVSLFELANRDDTQACPQSVCVTQDLASCYANVDGPGWVEERIEVCDETLARIDPTWACFHCLSNEKAEALLDDGRGEDALAFLAEQEKKILAAGEEVFDSLLEMRVAILLNLGRAEQALALIGEMEEKVEGAEWNNISQPRRLYKAHGLALLGRDEEALEALLPFSEIAPRYRTIWLRAVYLLLQRTPERNTWDLGGRLQQMLEHYSQKGAHRVVIDVASQAIRLALQRGSVWSARRHLALAEQHAQQLQRDRGASQLLAGLRAEIDAAPQQQELPVPAAELLDWLAAQGSEDAPRNPEKEVQWLLQALAERPDDTALREVAASALQACSADDEAIDLLWEYVERHTDEEQQLAYYLLNALLARGEYDQVKRLGRLYADSVPLIALWSEVKLAEKLNDWPELERACQSVLEISPGSLGAHSLLGKALMEQDRFAEAALAYQRLAGKLEEPQSVQWDQMTAASAARDWTMLREVAAGMGMEFAAGNGPIEEDWGWVIVRYIEDGEALDYYARRTGPVTARVLENAPGNRSQRVGDWVVFDAGLIYPAPEDEEERKRFVPTYAVVHVLESGGYSPSWLVDGVYPGDEAFDAFRETLDARGWKVWVHSNRDYQVTDASSGEELRAIYFTVATPAQQAPRDLHQALQEATGQWPHRMCWLRLAEAAEVDTQPHLDAIERYGL
ncbi:TPA: hypothetical protein L4H08_001635 [Pseudomonas aeruginosa]|nr:hypothetical protein [Pseudomonas aeruginosa]